MSEGQLAKENQRFEIPWTTADIALLIDLNKQGLSSTQIAAHFKGRTRNSIIGKLCRLRIASGYKPPLKSKGPARLKKPKVPKVPRIVTTSINAFELPAEVVDVAREDGKTLLELNPCDCRWPYGLTDYYFCARPRMDGSSYCPGHDRYSKPRVLTCRTMAA